MIQSDEQVFNVDSKTLLFYRSTHYDLIELISRLMMFYNPFQLISIKLNKQKKKKKQFLLFVFELKPLNKERTAI